MLIDFCLRNEVSIMNVYYKHKDSHKWSWYRWNSEAGDYVQKSIIVFFITNNKTLFIDVKSLLSVSFDSDHKLVLSKLTMKKKRKEERIEGEILHGKVNES